MYKLKSTLPPHAMRKARPGLLLPVTPNKRLMKLHPMSASSPAKSAPPMNEKSFLLVKAYSVIPEKIARVMTSASRTILLSPLAAYLAQILPTNKLSENVNTASRCILSGYESFFAMSAKSEPKVPTMATIMRIPAPETAALRRTGMNMKAAHTTTVRASCAARMPYTLRIKARRTTGADVATDVPYAKSFSRSACMVCCVSNGTFVDATSGDNGFADEVDDMVRRVAGGKR